MLNFAQNYTMAKNVNKFRENWSKEKPQVYRNSKNFFN